MANKKNAPTKTSNNRGRPRKTARTDSSSGSGTRVLRPQPKPAWKVAQVLSSAGFESAEEPSVEVLTCQSNLDSKPEDLDSSGEVVGPGVADPVVSDGNYCTDDDDDDDDEESEVLHLEFLIPIDGATESQVFDSNAEWDTFIYKVAGETGIKKDLLQLAYKFNTAPAKDLPKLLTKPIHFSGLWDDARKELAILTAKRSKVKKDLKVHLYDRRAKSTTNSKSDRSKKLGAAGRMKNHAGSNLSETGSDLLDVDPGKKTKTDYVKELTVLHDCNKHKVPCIVIPGRDHYRLSNFDISLWALLLAEGHVTSMTIPPKQLKIEDAKPRARSTGRDAYNLDFPAARGVSGQATQARLPYQPSPPTTFTVPGVADPSYEPTLYPRISDWLLQLDAGARGADGQNFSQYGEAFIQNGYTRIFQFADEGKNATGAHDLVQVSGGMSLGLAKLLIKYAQADCEAIQRKRADDYTAPDASWSS